MKSIRDIQVMSETVRLTHRDTGEEREFLLRPFRDEDTDGVMACVRSEYGESYFKRFFYDSAKIREKAKSKDYDFFVAETDGEIAGFEIFSYPEKEDRYIEACSQILNRRFRGYGMSGVMVDYIFRVLVDLEPSAIYVLAVTFHTSTQYTYVKRGMVPTGFRLGRFLTEMMENSYRKGRCDKYSEGIMIRPVAKTDAGIVYLPDEAAPFGENVYRELGVRYEIRTGSDSRAKPDAWESLPGEGEYRVTVDEIQQFVEVRVIAEGQDLGDLAGKLVGQYTGMGYYTIQIIFYDDTPVVFDYYEELKKLGYFFTGLRPLCGDREQICMQWVDDWNLCMEDYVLTEPFRRIEEEIKIFYDGRITG